MVHPMPKPSCAPAWLYVPMPDGSSSEAPVMSPGPNTLRPRRAAAANRDSPCCFRTIVTSSIVRGVTRISGRPLRDRLTGVGFVLAVDPRWLYLGLLLRVNAEEGAGARPTPSASRNRSKRRHASSRVPRAPATYTFDCQYQPTSNRRHKRGH
jgi:hypothetical protein